MTITNKRDAEYYAHLLENVRKYTGKWLAEEVLQFDMQSQGNKNNYPIICILSSFVS